MGRAKKVVESKIEEKDGKSKEETKAKEPKKKREKTRISERNLSDVVIGVSDSARRCLDC